MYVEYLRDFWYTAEVDDATKYISFSLSLFENQLSFTRFDFLIAIGLTDSKTVVPLPPKGTVRVGLATLELTDKDKPSLTSTKLVNSSPLKLPKKIVEKEEITEEQTLEIPTVAQLLDEVNKEAQETPESPYDTESVSGFEVADSDDTHDNNVSHSTHISHDIASAERLSLPDHLDHICKEVSSLHSRLGNMESSIIQTISAEIKSSLPAMITNALKEQLPRILSATLKECLPLIVKESLQTHSLAASEQFVETQTQLNKKVVKQLNRQFNISHVA
ncbi:hypothetical protein Tco_0853456 [Tanacetum coccineum]